MKLLIFAQTSEAQATLNLLKAKPLQNSERNIWKEGLVPTCYRFEQGHIVISDIGLHAAAATLALYHHGHHEIWNLGLAAALNDRFTLFSLLSIAHVGKFVSLEELDTHTTSFVQATLPQMTLQQDGAHLISSDLPIHHGVTRQKLANLGYDLVDMEGYALAYLSHRLQIPCKIWKIVSDFASEGGMEIIKKHKQALSEHLAQHVAVQLAKS